MRILVIGSGGREHALIWALHRTATQPLKIFCAPGNAGIAQLAECVPISVDDLAGARGALLRMPVLPASANRIESVVEATLDADGRLQAGIQQRYFGQSGILLREIELPVQLQALGVVVVDRQPDRYVAREMIRRDALLCFLAHRACRSDVLLRVGICQLRQGLAQREKRW